MYAAAVIPRAKANTAYLYYATPTKWTKRIFPCRNFGDYLSTIDSYLFIAANTLSYDLAPKRWKHSIYLSKMKHRFNGLLSIAMAVVFSGSIKAVWKALGSYSAGCLLLPMLIAYFKKGVD